MHLLDSKKPRVLETNMVAGCYTCRLRRKKCDEGQPACATCVSLCVKCEYKRPAWWGSMEQRQMQKDRIKLRIRHTKDTEKNGNFQGA